MSTLGKIFFWEYPRESWQWWILVLLILTFIFATPREVFKDQPKAASIVILPADQGYLMDATLLDNVPEAQWPDHARELVRKRYNKHVNITHVEPVFDEAEEQVTGYMAYTKP